MTTALDRVLENMTVDEQVALAGELRALTANIRAATARFEKAFAEWMPMDKEAS